ncbi:MAG: hypothetical protein IBX69_12410 [Anaerolineales bacterium]|nr:hypothetical protein [Anaerolineales bacterium]
MVFWFLKVRNDVVLEPRLVPDRVRLLQTVDEIMLLLRVNQKAALRSVLYGRLASGFRYWAVAPLSKTIEEGCYSRC